MPPNYSPFKYYRPVTMTKNNITVRKINFTVPEASSFNPIYMLNSPAFSYRFTAIGLYAALLEPAMVKAIQKVIKNITDPELKSDVEKFCHQEAQHYVQHKRFNKLILSQGYPGLEECVKDLDEEFQHFLNEKPEKFMIGYIEGFESFTTQSAIQALSAGIFDHPDNSREFSDLFKWHMVEEIEHRTVAFDLYNHLYGDYLYRAKMCWFAQKHQERFITKCSELMSAHDVSRFGEKHQINPKIVKLLKFQKLKKSLKSMMPNYSPHKYVISDEILELSDHYNSHENLVPLAGK